MTNEVRDSIIAFATARKDGNFLLTTLASGLPYVVQMGGLVDPDFRVRLRTNAGSLKLKQITRHPQVGYLIVERTTDVQKNVLIQGHASFSSEKNVIESFFEDLKVRYNSTLTADNPRFKNSVIVTITPTFLRAEGFSEPAPPGIYTERLGS